MLSSASPVFNAMLNSTFLEGTYRLPTGEQQIQLSEDNAEGVILFCLIVHGRPEAYGLYRNFGIFERLAEFVDKYDATDYTMKWSADLYMNNLSRYLTQDLTTGWFDDGWISSACFDSSTLHLSLFRMAYAFKIARRSL